MAMSARAWSFQSCKAQGEGGRDLLTGKGGTRQPEFGRWNLTSSSQPREEMQATHVSMSWAAGGHRLSWGAAFADLAPHGEDIGVEYCLSLVRH